MVDNLNTRLNGFPEVYLGARVGLLLIHVEVFGFEIEHEFQILPLYRAPSSLKVGFVETKGTGADPKLLEIAKRLV